VSAERLYKRPPNELGRLLYKKKYRFLGANLFTAAADLATVIISARIPCGWEKTSLVGRLHDVTSISMSSQKFRRINDEFRQAILEAVGRRISDLGKDKDDPKAKKIVEEIGRSITQRQKTRDKEKRAKRLKPPTVRDLLEAERTKYRNLLKTYKYSDHDVALIERNPDVRRAVLMALALNPEPA